MLHIHNVIQMNLKMWNLDNWGFELTNKTPFWFTFQGVSFQAHKYTWSRGSRFHRHKPKHALWEELFRLRLQRISSLLCPNNCSSYWPSVLGREWESSCFTWNRSKKTDWLPSRSLLRRVTCTNKKQTKNTSPEPGQTTPSLDNYRLNEVEKVEPFNTNWEGGGKAFEAGNL